MQGSLYRFQKNSVEVRETNTLGRVADVCRKMSDQARAYSIPRRAVFDCLSSENLLSTTDRPSLLITLHLPFADTYGVSAVRLKEEDAGCKPSHCYFFLFW